MNTFVRVSATFVAALTGLMIFEDVLVLAAIKFTNPEKLDAAYALAPEFHQTMLPFIVVLAILSTIAFYPYDND